MIAEHVLPGHPDRVCDRVADALVDAALARDPRSLVGVEVALHRDTLFLTGCVTTDPPLSPQDVDHIARAAVAACGYGPDWPPDPARMRIFTDLRLERLDDELRALREISDDQAICIGWAGGRAADRWLPPLHRAAWVAAERLRILAPSHGLGPDGKVIVVGEAAGHATGIQRISLSLQHHTHADRAQLWHAAIDVAATVGITDRERITVNGGGDFDVGGPHGDNGLSGKKLVCDAYGPTVPIGGGAWSGKDPHKVDRVGGLRARQLALRAVRRGLGEKATATIGWFPGDRSPSLVRVVADGNPVPLAALGPLALDIATTARAFAGVRWAERVGRWFQEEGPWEAP